MSGKGKIVKKLRRAASSSYLPGDKKVPIHNAEIADMFDQLADLLEIEDANHFRVRAYRNAARTIRGYARSLADLLKQGEELTKLPDIGDELSKKIQTIMETGALPLLDKVRSRTPAALSQMMKIEGLGPKRVRQLYQKLKIESLDDLRQALRSGELSELEGFGKKSEQKIKDRLRQFKAGEQRTTLLEAEQIARPLIEYLKNGEGVNPCLTA